MRGVIKGKYLGGCRVGHLPAGGSFETFSGGGKQFLKLFSTLHNKLPKFVLYTLSYWHGARLKEKSDEKKFDIEFNSLLLPSCSSYPAFPPLFLPLQRALLDILRRCVIAF